MPQINSQTILKFDLYEESSVINNLKLILTDITTDCFHKKNARIEANHGKNTATRTIKQSTICHLIIAEKLTKKKMAASRNINGLIN